MMPGSRLARWAMIAVVVLIVISFLMSAVQWGM
jgi:hypothetical protein